MGYMSPYNGYGYQATGTYGLMQYRLPPVQNQPAFTNLSPTQASALRAGSPRNFAVPPASYMGSAYLTVPRLQYPLAFSGGIRPFSGPSSPVPPEAANNHVATSSTVSGSAPDHVEGGSWNPLEAPRLENWFSCRWKD
ncbi:hypothetical protein HanOQP8_Chr02g0051581 [Helianthus annuus]|nr:hypothetical protein HanOQP8_Chr02g0051581 [Helianthus annuus]